MVRNWSGTTIGARPAGRLIHEPLTEKEAHMNQILAFWVHPRSISTGFERIFIERKDFKVLHEPFSPLYYVY